KFYYLNYQTEKELTTAKSDVETKQKAVDAAKTKLDQATKESTDANQSLETAKENQKTKQQAVDSAKEELAEAKT
ncbi:hypothetical protein DTQ60_01950, partial [Ureaplasma urealyticum]